MRIINVEVNGLVYRLFGIQSRCMHLEKNNKNQENKQKCMKFKILTLKYMQLVIKITQGIKIIQTEVWLVIMVQIINIKTITTEIA